MEAYEDLTTEELVEEHARISLAGSFAAAHGVELPDSAFAELARIRRELERRAAIANDFRSASA